MVRRQRKKACSEADLELASHSNGNQAGWPRYFCAAGGKQWWYHDAETLTANKFVRFLRWQQAGIEIRSRLPLATMRCTGPNSSDEELRALYLSQALPEPGYGPGPEARICQELKLWSQQLGWVCDKTFGTVYQSGWPDFYMAHKDHGTFWVEVKTESGALEASQFGHFSKLEKYGIGVWVVRDAETFMDVLKKAPNWRGVRRKKWKVEL